MTPPKMDGRRARAEEGAYVGGVLPFGLQLDAWGRWERNKSEEWVLREFAARRALGATYAELADWLNNPRRPEWSPPPSPGGKRWTAGMVHRLLRRDIYYRRPEDVPERLTGLRYIRATYNYGATGILAKPPTKKELDRNAPFVAHRHGSVRDTIPPARKEPQDGLPGAASHCDDAR